MDAQRGSWWIDFGERGPDGVGTNRTVAVAEAAGDGGGDRFRSFCCSREISEGGGRCGGAGCRPGVAYIGGARRFGGFQRADTAVAGIDGKPRAVARPLVDGGVW